MRRVYKGRSDAMVRNAEGEQGFWPSYADMMSAVALILFFLMLLSYIQNLITGNNLRSTQDQLANTEQNLADTKLQLSDLETSLKLMLQQVDEAQAQLRQANEDLTAVQLSLSQKEQDLAAQEEQLAAQKQQMEEQSRELENQTRQLSDQDARIVEQEEYLRAANEEIIAMRNQMSSIAVLRLSILSQIRESVISVMGDASKVSIGDNGNIVLNEGVFFDSGQSEIKADAYPTLNQLINVFQQFLSDPENIKYVDSIVISGHTDSDGADAMNRTLSSARANAVLGYLLDYSYGKLDPYKSYFCAAGYGETRPVADNNTAEGKAQNRRIEISIILRDDSVMDIVQNYLDIDLPASVEAANN